MFGVYTPLPLPIRVSRTLINYLRCLSKIAQSASGGGTEREVNEVLKQWHTFEDWALLRRELFMYKFLKRYKDGTQYWVNELEEETSE